VVRGYGLILIGGVLYACQSLIDSRETKDQSDDSQATSPTQSTSKRVAQLVDELASPVPPPHPDGWVWTSLLEPSAYEHPKVSAATEQLVAMGTVAFPELVKHLNDRRYSYSATSATWINFPVGVRVQEILSNEMEPCGRGYDSAKVEARETPTGIQERSTFPDYFAQLELTKWADRAARLGRNAIRREFVRWYVDQEENHGFVDDKQRVLVIGPCVEELERLGN
jgi:hypothetical protein